MLPWERGESFPFPITLSLECGSSPDSSPPVRAHFHCRRRRRPPRFVLSLPLRGDLASSSVRVFGKGGGRNGSSLRTKIRWRSSFLADFVLPFSCTVANITMPTFVASFWSLVIFPARDFLPTARSLRKGWHFG